MNLYSLYSFSSVQFSSVTQPCLTLCDPMDCSTPGLPVHYQVPEFTQTHVHRVGDAIQPSHPLSSPSPLAPNPSQLYYLVSSKQDQVFPCSSVSKESACNAGDLGSIPGLGRSPGEGNGNPLQYCCLENPIDRGAWRAIVHGVARVGHDLATKPPPQHLLIYLF